MWGTKKNKDQSWVTYDQAHEDYIDWIEMNF